MSLDLDAWPPEVIAKHYADGLWEAATMPELSRTNARERGDKIAYIDNKEHPATYSSMEAGVMPGLDLSVQLSTIPLGRAGKVEDITRTIAFLLGDGGAFHTGQTFPTAAT